MNESWRKHGRKGEQISRNGSQNAKKHQHGGNKNKTEKQEDKRYPRKRRNKHANEPRQTPSASVTGQEDKNQLDIL